MGVGLYFIPNTVDMVKKILNLPDSYYSWLEAHISLVAIVGGSLIAVQFLFVIIAGIHASELRKPREENELPLTQEDVPRQTYREKATEKYNLDKNNH